MGADQASRYYLGGSGSSQRKLVFPGDSTFSLKLVAPLSCAAADWCLEGTFAADESKITFYVHTYHREDGSLIIVEETFEVKRNGNLRRSNGTLLSGRYRLKHLYSPES